MMMKSNSILPIPLLNAIVFQKTCRKFSYRILHIGYVPNFFRALVLMKISGIV